MGLAAVGAVHRYSNLPNPAEDEGVRATMRGITRIACRAQKQAIGLTAGSLAAIRASPVFLAPAGAVPLRPRKPRQQGALVGIALISMMRDGMLRRSEAESLYW